MADRVLPWQAVDPGQPRYGLTVASLVYVCTKKNDPPVYAGASDIRWADDATTTWTVNPR